VDIYLYLAPFCCIKLLLQIIEPKQHFTYTDRTTLDFFIPHKLSAKAIGHYCASLSIIHVITSL